MLRRSPQRPLDLHTFDFPGGEVNLERRQVRRADGSTAELSEREADFLRYLAANPSRVITRDEITHTAVGGN